MKWEWRIGKPKSFKSNRRISATESVTRLLAELKVGRSDSDFLFQSTEGGFIDPDKFDAEIWKLIAQAANMPGTRFHGLRHFFASQLIANGETAADVRDQMATQASRSSSYLFPGRGHEASGRYEMAMEKARANGTGC